jgi:hypothetical protein
MSTAGRVKVTREALDAVVREQLREAWERGMETAPHGVNALADKGAAGGFRAVERAVDDYLAAVAVLNREFRAITWNNTWADGGPGEAELLAAELTARLRRLGAALRKLIPHRDAL